MDDKNILQILFLAGAVIFTIYRAISKAKKERKELQQKAAGKQPQQRQQPPDPFEALEPEPEDSIFLPGHEKEFEERHFDDEGEDLESDLQVKSPEETYDLNATAEIKTVKKTTKRQERQVSSVDYYSLEKPKKEKPLKVLMNKYSPEQLAFILPLVIEPYEKQDPMKRFSL